jgi:hypothetical protein
MKVIIARWRGFRGRARRANSMGPFNHEWMRHSRRPISRNSGRPVRSVPRGYPKAQIRQGGSKCRCVKRDAHRPHAEALGSSAQMRCVSCWYRQSRVTAKSTSRTPRTIQILMRIRAALPPVRTHARRGSRKRPDPPLSNRRAGTCHNAGWLGESWPRELLRPDRRG